jgi:hypothetical protein
MEPMSAQVAAGCVDELTPLQRQLAGDRTPVRPSALDAFRLARRKFLAGERVDMSALAAELGVNRVTLYRWAGSRGKLLVEVLWSLSAQTLERERMRAEGRGAERIAQIVSGFVATVLSSAGTGRFMAEEGERAMRLLTRRDTGFQPRLIDAIEALLAEETVRGNLELPADLHDVAYTIVRIVESYVYLDRITGEEPDPRRAQSILRLLLR